MSEKKKHTKLYFCDLTEQQIEYWMKKFKCTKEKLKKAFGAFDKKTK